MKTTIYLVRHAETIGNIENRLTGRTDFKITENGKKTINALTKRLSNINFDSFYSSSSNRSKITIEPLAILNKKKIHELKELDEMYFGDYDGYTWDEVNKINLDIKKRQIDINEISGIPNQETMEEVADRMKKALDSILEKENGKTILICSHGVAIEALLRKIVNIPFSKERERFCQHNTAVNIIEAENKNYNLIKIADLSHIEDCVEHIKV